MADTTHAAEETQVLVQFETKLPPEYRVPEVAIAVPTKLKRLGLSQVINHLLALDPPKPFDFIVNGELLRTTLEQHMLTHSISPEAVLKVEYVPVVLPPKPKLAVPHDDWVSAVAHSPLGFLVTGSYDGSVALWSEQGARLCCIGGAHPLGVSAVAALPKAQGELLLSGGKDTAVSLWHVPQQGTEGATLVARYTAHTQAVTALAASPSGGLFCSCSWDGGVHMWATGRTVQQEAEEQAPGEGAGQGGKKRKTGGDDAANGDAGSKRRSSSKAAGPKLVVEESQRMLTGHLHAVSALSWPREDVVYSGGSDHSVRRWDAETGRATDTHHGSRAVLALSSSVASPSLVAFGCADPTLRVWDVRNKKSESINVTAYTSHAGWITSVAWHPTSPHHVITGAHDGCVKVWDVRSKIPLASLAQHTDKVLCCAWLGSGSSLASGGADCQLQVYELQAPLNV